MDKTLGLGLVIGASLGSSVANSFKTVDQKLQDLNSQAQKFRMGQAAAERLDHLSGRLEKLKGKTVTTAEQQEKLDRVIQKIETRLGQATEQARQYGVSLSSAAADAKRMGQALDSVERRARSLQAEQKRSAMRRELKSQALETLAMGAAMGYPIKKAIEFESAMSGVKKVVNFDTPEGFKKMGKSILGLSTLIPMSAEGIADIVAAAGQAGIARHELLGFAQDAAKMGVAFDMSGKEAGSAMTGLRSIFKLNQTQVVLLSDSYNHLSNNMDATARDILNFANRAGSTGALVGLTGQQIGALGAAFLQLKTPPEVAARATNSMIMKLRTAEQAGTKFQKALNSVGLDAGKISKLMKEDAQKGILTFLAAVKKSENPIALLRDTMGEGFADEIAKLVDGLDHYEKAIKLSAKQADYAGSVNKEYQERANTTANSLQLLSNTTTKMAVNLGTVLLPAVNQLATGLAKPINTLAELAERFPTVTKVVMGTAVGFMGLKIATMGARFGLSYILDGAGIAYRAMLMLRPSVIKTNIALLAQKWSAFKAGTGLKILAGAQKAYAIGSAIMMGALKGVRLGFNLLKLAIISNPIGAIAVGIATAAALIYANWDKVLKLFKKIKNLWSKFKGFLGFDKHKPGAPVMGQTAKAQGAGVAQAALSGDYTENPAVGMAQSRLGGKPNLTVIQGGRAQTEGTIEAIRQKEIVDKKLEKTINEKLKIVETGSANQNLTVSFNPTINGGGDPAEINKILEVQKNNLTDEMKRTLKDLSAEERRTSLAS